MNAVTGPVVVGVDGSGQAASAARWAVREAALWHTSLTVLTASAVADPASGGKASAWLETKAVLAQQVARATRDELAAAEPLVPVMTKTSTAGAEAALRQASAGALVLVLGPPTGTLSGLLAGSPDADLIARAGCPVVIVRGTGATRAGGPVVVGVDGSPMSDAALAWAFEEASRRGTRLVAVHAWRDTESGRPFASNPGSPLVEIGEVEQRLLAERLAGRRERYPDVDVEPVVERDLPGDKLLERSAEAALVVVGSRGRGGFTGMVLGSTTHALLHRADCPVMVVGGELRA
ncbi:universal stress protein [Amycolatopsis carbonis]|uniref:Universal stress protein n=1 Tax=Amycolatopsis carbonis TaxID=715471 RepID=A0A9Y2N273_9PSEU|nr:universal stress protein [Amycolatopsis sp. 2-15]WIX83724.1 universal stress protein [Amycolatopsis sp. 2-15]